MMCSSEIKAKLAARKAKKDAEMRHKALCKKEELDQKYTEKKLKLSVKKEKYSKSVSEGKQKYLHKKLKHAEEVTVKTAGKGKEFAEKLSEKANKREDKLYKKECASKESAYKAVREGKQKMKIVYVTKAPHTKAKLAKAKPEPEPRVVHKPKPAAKLVKHVRKPVVHKPVVHKPAVHKHVVHKVKKVVKHHVSSLKEVLIKTGEKSDKAQIKSHELMTKSIENGKVAVAKEAVVKSHELTAKHNKARKDHNKEKRCKEKDSKEDSGKVESKAKLKIDRMNLAAARKEAKGKVVKPPKQKPCNPVTALEKYVKKCKKSEEKFAKAKISDEAEVKEIKHKDKLHEQNRVCKLVHSTCREIYKVSTIREQHIVKLMKEHTKELEAQVAKTAKFEHEKAVKMKYHICESAAKDMKYFVSKLLYTVPKTVTNKVANEVTSEHGVPLRLGLEQRSQNAKQISSPPN